MCLFCLLAYIWQESNQRVIEIFDQALFQKLDIVAQKYCNDALQ